jgi:hypothetical protein
MTGAGVIFVLTLRVRFVLVLRWMNAKEIEHERHGRAIYPRTLFVHAKPAENSHQSRIQILRLVETHGRPAIPLAALPSAPNIFASLLFSLPTVF